jgi:hypothetical protein
MLSLTGLIRRGCEVEDTPPGMKHYSNVPLPYLAAVRTLALVNDQYSLRARTIVPQYVPVNACSVWPETSSTNPRAVPA